MFAYLLFIFKIPLSLLLFKNPPEQSPATLSLYLSVFLSVYPTICIYNFTTMSFYLLFTVSLLLFENTFLCYSMTVQFFVCLCVCLSVCPSLCVSTFKCLSVYMFVCLYCLSDRRQSNTFEPSSFQKSFSLAFLCSSMSV